MSESTPELETQPGDAILAELADEFLRRHRAGEHPSAEEVAGAHPELAERIRNLFPAMIAMEHSGIGPTMDGGPPMGRIGTMLGRYKLLERIGEGGFGVVYMAEQQQPVRRKVALKVVKPGMDSRQVLARFEAERQALAIMDHPNIAKVFDAGATDTGRPYFVMELVRGEPITEFCDRNQFSPPQRLKLFAQVCHAVQHAHQKGIIHRDIKPTNVLVAMHDTTPTVKVIDFGVAKALGQELTDKTLFTGFAQFLGTPLYMSPEQAGQSSLDVDTRSDVYSLGVLLYELLTGTTPFDKERFKKAAHDEIFRIIREEEPPKPSTRLSESKGALASISAQRQTEPTKLARLVRGDLDWIVMKALEKDCTRRYETASGMARDIERYLNDEPVEACPPSTGYRLRKFLSRNKGPAVAASLVLLTLISGIAGTSFGLVRAERARRAEALRAEGERQARQESQEREEETKAVLDFVEGKIFAAARPEGWTEGLGYDVTLRQAIDAALSSLDKDFADRPLIEARLRTTLGESFNSFDEQELANEQFSKALSLYAKHLGQNHLDTIRSRVRVAGTYSNTDRNAEALKVYEEAFVQFKAQLGPYHHNTFTCMNNIAGCYASLGRHAEAVEVYEELLKLAEDKPGPSDGQELISMMNLAEEYFVVGRHADSLKLFEETLRQMIEDFGPDHPTTLVCKNNVSTFYFRMGRYAEAFKLSQEVLASAQAKLGPDHPGTLGYMKNLASCYDGIGQHSEAHKLYEETLALMNVKLGPDDPETSNCRGCLANSYAHAGKHADAARITEGSLVLRKAKFGADHPNTLATMNTLAQRYTTLGRHGDALKLREELLALQKTKLGPEHTDTLATMKSVLDIHEALGSEKLDEAIDRYRASYQLEPDNVLARNQLIGALNRRSWKLATDADAEKRDPDRAVELATEVVDLTPEAADSWNNLGVARYRAGDYAGAIAALEKFRELRTNSQEWSNPFFLAMANWQLGKKEEAQRWFETAVNWMDRVAPTSGSLLRFRAEATELLGMNEKSQAATQSPSVQ